MGREEQEILETENNKESKKESKDKNSKSKEIFAKYFSKSATIIIIAIILIAVIAVVYYVSYEATVDAGIDFEKIEISVDNEAKIVTINLPKAEILDTYVDIASLDYIFIDKKANNETVSEEAFKLCKYDVKHESENQEAIIDLAQQNAENVVKALVQPFVDQVDPDYKIVVE